VVLTELEKATFPQNSSFSTETHHEITDGQNEKPAIEYLRATSFMLS